MYRSLPDANPSSHPFTERRPDNALIEDLCNYFLGCSFHTDLFKLKARPEAWEAVSRCWHELSRIVDAEDAPPSDGVKSHSPGGSSASGSGSASKGRGRKRPNQQPTRNNNDSGEEGSNADENRDDDDGDWDGRQGFPTSIKKVKMESSAPLSCPYRKRNPLRFNIRDHASCATQPYKDISDLK